MRHPHWFIDRIPFKRSDSGGVNGLLAGLSTVKRRSVVLQTACIVRMVVISGFAGLSCLTNLQAQTYSEAKTGVAQAGYQGPVSTTVDPVCCEQEFGIYDGMTEGEGYCGPYYFFQADYLFWTRDSSLTSGPIINGPDSFNYNDLDFGFDSGYRLKGAVAMESVEFEAAWTQIDGWNDSQSGQLTTGLGFDAGASFAGANLIDGGTFFQPLFRASSFNFGGTDETLEDEGLGPVGIFADPAATYQTEYNSSLQDLELMAKYAPFWSRVKFGIGYRRVTLDELARASITGTFRAVDAGVGANGGLSHTALTDPNGGNLQLISGAADGFDDETALLGTAGPDQLQMLNSAITDNTLNGVQFSMEALLIESQWVLLDATLKAGAFQNQIDASLTERYSGTANDDSVYGRAFNDSASEVAFVGQIGLGATIRLNHFARLRAGWDVLFVSGVALAPDQTANVQAGTFTLNNDGDMVANGGHIGLELAF